MTSGVSHLDKKLLLLIFVFQALLCYNFYCREVAGYAPPYYDQTTFLNEAYALQENILTKGLSQLWPAVWSPTHFSSLALPIEGALAGLLLPGARVPQLILAFVSFCALQLVIFYTAKMIFHRRAYGYMALGLILCQVSPWNGAGGLFDFRLDFFAYCLYGIWACAAMRSELFFNRRWAIGAGLVGALLILHRFISAAYLIGVYAGFGVLCAIFLFRSGQYPERSRRMRKRIFNLGLSVGILGLIAGPVLIRNYKPIATYYISGHATSSEKYIRAREFGITNLIGHLNYYPISLVRDHLGSAFFLATAIAIVGGVIARIFCQLPTGKEESRSRQEELFLLQLLFLSATIMWPITVLTADISKSPVVGGIAGAPVALLVVLLVARITPVPGETGSSFIYKLNLSCSLIVLAIGLSTEFVNLARHLPEYVYRRDRAKLAEINQWIFTYARKHNWKNATISFDTFEGELNSGTISALGYEQSHEIIAFQPALGSGIMGVDLPEALAQLAKSDFFVLTTSPKTGVYPFYQRIASYWLDLKAWADKNMLLVHTAQLDGYTASVYVRANNTSVD